MLKYFKECKSVEECKKLYKKLAFIHHPDRGGDTETMKAINAEFDYVIENHIFKDTKKDNTKKTAKKDYDFSTSQFKDIIQQLIKFDNIVIDIVGCFIWVSGNTYPVKEELKQLGFRYSKNKKSWYIAPVEYMQNRKSYKRQYSMEEIKNKYGCTTINSKGGYKKEYEIKKIG